jgi:hypothetical protein
MGPFMDKNLVLKLKKKDSLAGKSLQEYSSAGGWELWCSQQTCC